MFRGLTLKSVRMNSIGKVGQTLRPGQDGTRKLSRRFGEKLLLVRYRYDAARQMRLTTVELLVDQSPWIPPADQIVYVKVGWTETDLRKQLKETGARWNKVLRRWETTREIARKLGVENRLD